MTAPALQGRPAAHSPFSDVSRIAVLRGGGFGDLVMAMPAINALANTYPEAEIVLLGMPSHAELLKGRGTCISRVEILPIAEGIRPGKGRPDPAALQRYVARQRAQNFDLAVQMHGGGRHSNPLVNALQATHTVGSRAAGAESLERNLQHQYFQHEVLRDLEVAGLAGAASTNHRLEWGATKGEQERARALLPFLSPQRPLVLLHPGASDPRRRWPAVRFGSIAASLAGDGCQLVVVGDQNDRALVQEVVETAHGLLGSAAAHRNVVPLAGADGLGGLCGMLSLCSLVVANDSGPRHVAEALGVPTASVFWAPNVVNAAPLLRERHRVQIAWDTTCPVCRTEAAGQAVPECGHQASFVAAVPVRSVLDDAQALLTP